METFREDLWSDHLGHPVSFCQDNESKSNRGVLRGLHYQLPPHAQTKLVRVIQGKALDVVVDIRQGSPTFGHHIALELSADNKRQLLIPKGFAHGFAVLEDHTIFSYKVDAYYHADSERGIAFDDPQLAIQWLLKDDELILSEKDRQHPHLKDCTDLFSYYPPSKGTA